MPRTYGGRKATQYNDNGSRDIERRTCKFWLQNNCRYGNKCRFYHPQQSSTRTAQQSVKTVYRNQTKYQNQSQQLQQTDCGDHSNPAKCVEIVRKELDDVPYLFTSYRHAPHSPFQFDGDISFEELLIENWQAQQKNTMPNFHAEIQARSQQQMQKREQLLNRGSNPFLNLQNQSSIANGQSAFNTSNMFSELAGGAPMKQSLETGSLLFNNNLSNPFISAHTTQQSVINDDKTRLATAQFIFPEAMRSRQPFMNQSVQPQQESMPRSLSNSLTLNEGFTRFGQQASASVVSNNYSPFTVNANASIFTESTHTVVHQAAIESDTKNSAWQMTDDEIKQAWAAPSFVRGRVPEVAPVEGYNSKW